MHRYILKRIAFLIPTILGVTFIIYAEIGRASCRERVFSTV